MAKSRYFQNNSLEEIQNRANTASAVNQAKSQALQSAIAAQNSVYNNPARQQDHASQMPSRATAAAAPTVVKPSQKQVDTAIQMTLADVGSGNKTLMQKATEQPQKQSFGKTVFDVVDRGAGYVNQYIASAADFAANLLPRVEGAITGDDPSVTFTGVVLKPITNATGKFKDWVDTTTQNIDARIQNDTKDSKAAQIAADVGSGVIAALPNAILAMMSGGASAATTLAPQTSGAAATAGAAAKKMVSNPMFKLSAAQSLGSGYDEAKANGATDEEAVVAAVLSAAFNSAVEVGGGIEALPGQLSGADLSNGQKALKWVTSMLDEGKEEVVQGAISKLTEKAVFDENKALYSAEDENAVINPGRMAQEFGMGAAVGGVLGGGQVLADAALSRAAKPKANTPVDAAIQETLQSGAKPVDQTRAYNAVENILEMPRINNTTANEIISNPDVSKAFAEITGVSLDGTTEEKRQLIRNTVRTWQTIQAENEQIAMRSAEQANAEYEKNQTEQAVRNSGYRSYVMGMLTPNGTRAADAQEILRSPDLKAEWETITGKTLPENYKSALKMIQQTKRNPIAISREESVSLKAEPPVNAKSNEQNTHAVNANKVQPNVETDLDLVIQQTLNQNKTTARGKKEAAKPVVGDLGAKTSDFPREVKESQGNTTPEYYEAYNIPEEGRADSSYTTRSWEEARHNANLRLEQDYDGEVEYLKSKPTWTDEEMAEGDMLLNKLREAAEESGDWTAHREWAKTFNAHKEEAGRALAFLASLKRGTGDSVVANSSAALDDAKAGTNVNEVMQTVDTYAKELDDAVAAKSVDDLVRIIRETAVERKTKKKWGRLLGGEIDLALKRIAKYAKADNADSFDFLQNFAASSIEAIAEDATKANLGEQVKTIRRNSMLSKVSTIMRNLVGNGAFDGIDTLARNVSVPLDMLLSKFTGTRSVAYDRGALSKEGRQGMLDGLAKALLEVGLDVNSEGAKSKYESSSSRTFKMNTKAKKPKKNGESRTLVVPQLFSTWEKYMGYALTVTDEAAKGSVEARVQRGLDKLYEQGKIKADDNSLKNGGAQEALYRTFQDNSALAEMSVGMRNALNKVHVGHVGLGDVTMPFAQVPANLADRAIDYSPAGLAKSAYSLADVLVKAKRGTLTAAEQAKAVQTLGRNITGSTLIAIAAAAAMKGLIHVENPGGEDENKDLAAYKKMQGLTGTQFNLSGLMRWANGEDTELENEDVLMSIAFLEPFNAHLTIGALLAEDLEEEGALSAKTIAKDSLTGALTAIMDLPMFSAFGDAYDAYQYSDKEREGEKLADAANTLLANEVSSIVPNAWKGIAQGLDPYQRDLYSKDDAWGQTADQFRAVFDRDSLPIKQDPYGRDMTNEGGALNFLNTNILPGQITKYRETDLDKAIMDTYERTGSASVFMSRKAPDEITVDGTEIALAPEQQRRYQEIYGQAEQGTREALYGNRLYDNLDPKLEEKAHEIAEDYAKQTAKTGMMVGYKPDKWVSDLKGKSAQEIAETVIQKTMESAAEDKKLYENKYVGISALLDDGTIDDKVALAIMSDSAVDGYMDYCKKAGVSVAQYADVYAYMNKTDDKEKTLKYIQGLSVSKAKKVALAQGIYGANPTFIPKDTDVPKNWLLEMGATDEIVKQFSESQNELYGKYIKGSDVDMGDYLAVWEFKGKAKSDKDANGKTTYSAQNKVIDYIDTLKIGNKEKRKLFLSQYDSEKNIPYWWK